MIRPLWSARTEFVGGTALVERISHTDLSVAGAAIRQATAQIEMILRGQFFPFSELVRRGLPGHIEKFLARPNEFLRITVAFEAPFHVKRTHSPGDGHLIDTTMAGGTTESLCDMDAVIEVNVIGQIVHPRPF